MVKNNNSNKFQTRIGNGPEFENKCRTKYNQSGNKTLNLIGIEILKLDYEDDFNVEIFDTKMKIEKLKLERESYFSDMKIETNKILESKNKIKRIESIISTYDNKISELEKNIVESKNNFSKYKLDSLINKILIILNENKNKSVDDLISELQDFLFDSRKYFHQNYIIEKTVEYLDDNINETINVIDKFDEDKEHKFKFKDKDVNKMKNILNNFFIDK